MTSVGSLQVQLLSIAVLSLQRQLYHNRSLSESTVQPAYDFVIVGGGAAGCIVASRLSENPNVPVLLLETGGPPTITSDILPAFYYFNYNWGYLTTPQKYSAFGIRDRRLPSKYLLPYISYAPMPVPGCSLCTDRPVSQCTAYLLCVARTLTFTSFHPMGTASMENSTSARAVVDERLRVLKVGNLRVVDASVMPTIPNANTNAPTMMVEEKAAQMLQEDHHI
ncbi:hypothetical protein TYRP_020909 [Tyrophagus putrescentiae]|nr:hypothetical protein TYRP_020909 [Tyrophagus putrescentiae]